ncbi:MAG: hypothetical protein ACRDQ0_03745, partial [Pseudonocardia sp.]
MGWQPRLLVDYQRRIYPTVLDTLYKLAAAGILAVVAQALGVTDPDHVHPLLTWLTAAFAVGMFWPHWRPRRAGGYERMTLWQRLTSAPKRAWNTPWERGGAVGVSALLWELPLLKMPLSGLAPLAMLHPATAWLAPILEVLELKVSWTGEYVAGKVADPVVSKGVVLSAEDRIWRAGGLAPVTRFSVAVGVPGLYVTVFAQLFVLAATGFAPVPGVSPPKIVGFRPWLRLKTRWMSYDQGVWSKTATMYVFWQGGVGLQLGEVGTVTLKLVEFRRSLKKLILRVFGRKRLSVEVFAGPARGIGTAVFTVLRLIARFLPARVRDAFVRLAAWRAREADHQQARHALRMIGLIKDVARRQKQRLVEIQRAKAGTRGFRLRHLERVERKVRAAKAENERRIARIVSLRFDRYQVARARRMMRHANAEILRAERRGLPLEELLEHQQQIELLLVEIAVAPAGLTTATPSLPVRVLRTFGGWLSRFWDWLVTTFDRVRSRLMGAGSAHGPPGERVGDRSSSADQDRAGARTRIVSAAQPTHRKRPERRWLRWLLRVALVLGVVVILTLVLAQPALAAGMGAGVGVGVTAGWTVGGAAAVGLALSPFPSPDGPQRAGDLSGDVITTGGQPVSGAMGDAAGRTPMRGRVVAHRDVVGVGGTRIVARARGPPRTSRPATDEDMRRIRDDLIVFENGVVLAASGAWRPEDGTVGEDRLRWYGPALRGEDGSFLLVTHADADGIFVRTAEADIRLSPAQVQDLLLPLAQFRDRRQSAVGAPVLVPACSLACAPAEYRRELAGGLGVTVRAPDVDVVVHPAAWPGGAAHVELLPGAGGSAGGWVDMAADGSLRSVTVPAINATTPAEETANSADRWHTSVRAALRHAAWAAGSVALLLVVDAPPVWAADATDAWWGGLQLGGVTALGIAAAVVVGAHGARRTARLRALAHAWLANRRLARGLGDRLSSPNATVADLLDLRP